MEAAFALSSQIYALNKPVSFKGFNDAIIDKYDFAAIKVFEELHPELYKDAIVPPFLSAGVARSTILGYQIAAFNYLFKHYRIELNDLIQEAKTYKCES